MFLPLSKSGLEPIWTQVTPWQENSRQDLPGFGCLLLTEFSAQTLSHFFQFGGKPIQSFFKTGQLMDNFVELSTPGHAFHIGRFLKKIILGKESDGTLQTMNRLGATV